MKKRNRLLSRITLILGGCGILLAIYTNQSNPNIVPHINDSTKVPSVPLNPEISTDADQSKSRHSLGAAGLVEPQSKLVHIGTNIPGIVSQVYVKPGQKVKKGDPLFLIDDREAIVKLHSAKASLAIAEAKLNESKARTAQFKDKVKSAEFLRKASQASLDLVTEVLKRDQKLFERKALSKEELNVTMDKFSETESKLNNSISMLEEARDELNLLLNDKGEDGPTITLLKSEIKLAEYDVEFSQVKLNLHRILSPIDGEVLQAEILVGEYAQLASDKPLMIVGNVDQLHVRVEIDESEIHRFQPQNGAIAFPRGQSQRRLQLKFVRTEPLVVPKQVLTGSTSQRVDTRVLQVIYSMEPGTKELVSGQQMDVFIPTTAK